MVASVRLSNDNVEAAAAAESTYSFVTASVLFTGAGTVTVPVNVGEASGAFSPNAVVMPEAYDASSLMAAANSLSVSNAPGAPPIKSVTAPVTKAVVAI